MEGKFIGGLDLKINPVPCVVDHSFKYFEQCDTKTKIILPPLYYYSKPDIIMPLIHSTNPAVTLKYFDDGNQIMLEFQT